MLGFQSYFRTIFMVVFVALLGSLTGCGATSRERRTNVLEFLYPEGKAEMPAEVVQLELPVNVGIAFVPESSSYDAAIRAGEKQALLERVREAFVEAEGLGRIEVVPDSFMSAGGGFENVRRIRSALGVELIVLVSFDQTQFDDPNLASITYWTIVGAYVVPGNENETHTLVYASVFDIESQAMLLNASGESRVEGSTTPMDLERSMRAGRSEGFELAVDDLIQNLQVALEQFREQVKSGTVRGKGTPAVQLSSASAGGGGGGGVGVGGLGSLGVVLGLLALSARRHA